VGVAWGVVIVILRLYILDLKLLLSVQYCHHLLSGIDENSTELIMMTEVVAVLTLINEDVASPDQNDSRGTVKNLPPEILIQQGRHVIGR
jgi:hypothetical protein